MQNKMKIIQTLKKPLLSVSILMFLLFTAGANDVEVRVNAPDNVSDTFEVTIDIENVMNLGSGQFDLSFDPSVVNVIEVEAGNIDNTEIPVDMWRFMDNDRIRVTFNLPDSYGKDNPGELFHNFMPDTDASGVDGSGYLAKITCTITGNPGDSCILSLSDVSDSFKRELGDASTDPIPAIWFDDTVIIGTNNLDAETAPTATAAQINPDGTTSSPTSISSITHESVIEDKPDTAIPSGILQKDQNKELKTLTSESFIRIYSTVGLLALIYALTLLKQ
jgi:hypothetical protein